LSLKHAFVHVLGNSMFAPVIDSFQSKLSGVSSWCIDRSS